MLPAPLKEADFLKAFALILVCSIAGSFVAGGVLGAIVGLFSSLSGAPLASMRLMATILGAAAGIVVSYLVFRWLVVRFIVRKLMPPAGVREELR